MAHWKRIVIDSRFKTRDSLSHSDFRAQLPYPCTLPRGTDLYCDAVSLSHCWSTVIAGKNDRLYLRETVVGSSGSPHERIITLAPGLYNEVELKAELQTKLQTGTNLPSVYTVGLSDGKLTVANSCVKASQGYVDWHIPSDEYWLAPMHPNFPGAWANELVGHLTNPSMVDGTAAIHSTQTMQCGLLDLQPHKAIYIHAPGLGESTCMTLSGATDCIRRVLLGGSVQGEIVNDAMQTTMAPISFGQETMLSVLHFRICGHDGRLIDMGGHDISFELIIDRPPN